MDKDVTQIKARLETLERLYASSTATNRLTSTIDKKVIEDAIKDSIIDIHWDDYLYFHTFFESIDGWTGGGTGGIQLPAGTGITLQTGTTTNDHSYIKKNPATYTALSFTQESRFRSNFIMQDIVDQKMSIGIGDNGESPFVITASSPHYGFRLEESILYAVSGNGTSETAIATGVTITAGLAYQVEARFLPGYRVDYYVSDGDGSKMISRCSIDTNLPSGSMVSPGPWIQIIVGTTTTDAVAVVFNSFEYIQKKQAL